MKINAADKMVQVMQAWGIDNVYGLPGDSVDTTIEALYRKRDEIKFTQVRHEEVAALAAAAHAKLTGQVSACLSIGGPGAIHLLNGLYDAKMDHAPVVAILGQIQSHLLNTGFFQEVNTPQLFEDVAVYNRMVTNPATLPAVMDEAIRAAYTHKGVAVLTIPDDVPDHKIPDTFKPTAGQFHLEAPKADVKDIDQALAMIKKAKNPVALIGVGAHDAQAQAKEFVERYSIPFIQTMPAKGTIDDDHPNALGQIGKLGTKPAYEAMFNADLLMLIGTDYPYAPYINQKIPTIQIDNDPSKIGHRHNIDVAIVADTKDALTLLNTRGEVISQRPFLKACQKNMKTWRSWMEDVKNKKHTGVLPSKMFAKMSEVAPDNTVWSIDVGTSTSFGARFVDAKSTQKYTISAWLGTMGCALPGAIASKIAMPQRPVYAINGDGAFAMVMQDFVTAVKYDLPMVVVVLNNHLLAFIEYEQQSAGQQNYGVDLADIDFAKFAEACGGIGINVTTDEEFAQAIKQYKNPTKPVLINAAVYDEAPLPGKIITDEAEGYMKFGFEYFKDKFQIPKMPPLREIIRQFL
ncbi:pyruvate oxidase [Bombilactobacillus folatiphilus]|uniref:Pyruvate oxidase n=1 Tax=Bombilactobacillus folatiphilus TaxID=2923362 RepID=A0ABY4P8Y0_9LACO|nr:pyruvate oxidase [Bombilactobacillus folatiphilus]UQS81976.1 pyruvate oxidase [Bombilactobacillus folatiphilus]